MRSRKASSGMGPSCGTHRRGAAGGRASTVARTLSVRAREGFWFHGDIGQELEKLASRAALNGVQRGYCALTSVRIRRRRCRCCSCSGSRCSRRRRRRLRRGGREARACKGCRRQRLGRSGRGPSGTPRECRSGKGRDSNPRYGVGTNPLRHAILRANAVKLKAKWVRSLLSAGRCEST
jgi:hypothetical protein